MVMNIFVEYTLTFIVYKPSCRYCHSSLSRSLCCCVAAVMTGMAVEQPMAWLWHDNNHP